MRTQLVVQNVHHVHKESIWKQDQFLLIMTQRPIVSYAQKDNMQTQLVVHHVHYVQKESIWKQDQVLKIMIQRPIVRIVK